MYDVILFGGTDEGHKIAGFLENNNISHVICVATEYGARIMDNKNVKIGRMNAEEMRRFFKESGVKIVVDATHPYAAEVTKNIKASCQARYIRIVREDIRPDGMRFREISSAVEYLKNTGGNILITTGSKDIAEFSKLCERAYARVLPSEESLKLCADAGFYGRHVICMQGPFSKELNVALMRELDIKYLVTKRSGKSGGFQEKIEAAHECGARSLIIERPVYETGASVEEAEKLILEYIMK